LHPKGVKAAVIISAGFKEAGTEGILLEEELKKLVKESGIRILGPNCLGIINTSNNINATFAAGMLPKGRLSFFSQSGAPLIQELDINPLVVYEKGAKAVDARIIISHAEKGEF
jgi:acetyltransferase